MLECGKNYKGSLSLQCRECNQIDDENHCMNHCKSYQSINWYTHDQKVDFNTVYSNDTRVLSDIIAKIPNVWNVCRANGSMNTSQ